MNTLLDSLQEPFVPDAITWKPGANKGDKCMALAYADLRAYMHRLDEVCGLDWSCRYVAWGEDRIMCELTISGVTRTSTGEMAAQDEKNEIGGTVAEAQAFKRACAMFGLGRYLYDLPSVWVGFDNAAKKISKEGQAELDRRYTAWYHKTMAERKQMTAPRQVDRATGEIIHSQPDKVQVDENGDVLFATEERQTLSEVQFKRLHAAGMKLYGKEEWDVQRHKLVEAVTNKRTLSSRELTPAEADRLIKGIERKQEEADTIQAQQGEAQEAKQAELATPF